MKPQMHGNPCFFSLIWLRLFTALYGPHLFNSHHYMSTYGYSYSAVSIIVCKFIRKHTNTSNTYGSKSYKLYVHIHRKQCQHVKRNKLPR